MAIRTPISDVSTFGRTAVGVKIVDTKEDDGVIDFAILSESGE
jgi:DNA gyrase/topoisomerase IV subunit A